MPFLFATEWYTVRFNQFLLQVEGDHDVSMILVQIPLLQE